MIRPLKKFKEEFGDTPGEGAALFLVLGFCYLLFAALAVGLIILTKGILLAVALIAFGSWWGVRSWLKK